MRALRGLLVMLGLMVSVSAQAEALPACDVPAYLVSSESALPKVKEALNGARPLNILVIGTRSSTIATPDSSAYPGRLEAALKESFPSASVNVSVELQIKKTAEESIAGFADLMSARKPTLVIWQTGTVDAIRSVDPDDFKTAIDDGVAALQRGGADVVLMNLQYSPRMETMISAGPYLDSMRVTAQQHDVPLFDRFAIMRQWSETGDFDLFNPTHGLELARRVHDCLGRALSTFVTEAAHVTPTDSRTQR